MVKSRTERPSLSWVERSPPCCNSKFKCRSKFESLQNKVCHFTVLKALIGLFLLGNNLNFDGTPSTHTLTSDMRQWICP